VDLTFQDLEQTKPQKKSDLIAERLKWFIAFNQLNEGDRLPKEQKLVEQFKASRWVVREALKSLEVQGLIEIVSGAQGGARVASVPYDQAFNLLANFFHFKHLTGAQIYGVRTVIEPIMAESVVGRLSEEDFTALEETLAVSRAGLAGELERMTTRRAELEFHNILARACPNPFIVFLCRFINDMLLHFVAFNAPMLKTHHQVTKSNLGYHQRLFNAYRKQDAPKVRELMRRHMIAIAKVMEKHQAYIEQGLVIPGSRPLEMIRSKENKP